MYTIHVDLGSAWLERNTPKCNFEDTKTLISLELNKVGTRGLVEKAGDKIDQVLRKCTITVTAWRGRWCSTMSTNRTITDALEMVPHR